MKGKSEKAHKKSNENCVLQKLRIHSLSVNACTCVVYVFVCDRVFLYSSPSFPTGSIIIQKCNVNHMGILWDKNSKKMKDEQEQFMKHVDEALLTDKPLTSQAGLWLSSVREVLNEFGCGWDKLD